MVVVSATVTCQDETQVVRAAEALSRAMLGLALEGMSTTLTILKMEPEEE